MTAQIPEILVHRNQQLHLCATPLESYLAKLAKTRRPDFFSPTTACYRGYVRRWEIKDGRLFLVDLQGYLKVGEDVIEADLAVALPWVKPPMMATWITDVLRCPEGRLLDYSHNQAFGSVYERDRLFLVERGIIKSEWVRLNPPSEILYRIDADGHRTCVDCMRPDADVLADPLDAEEDLVGYKVWGIPPSGDDEFVLGGYVQRIRETNDRGVPTKSIAGVRMLIGDAADLPNAQHLGRKTD